MRPKLNHRWAASQGARKAEALAAGMNQKTVTPVARLKNPAVRLRSLRAKAAVVPLSEAAAKRPGQTEKLQSLTPTPHNPFRCQSSTAKTLRKNGKPTCGFAHCIHTDFGMWRDKKISEGLKQWDERNKMTCDHADPCRKQSTLILWVHHWTT